MGEATAYDTSAPRYGAGGARGFRYV